MIDLEARHQSAAPAVEERVLSVLRSGHYVGGPAVAEVEALAARRMGRKAAVGLASGTDALILGLQVLGVQPGDEVVIPALSFFATAGAVCAVGAIPVVVDVGEDALLDPAAARAAVGPKTAAVIPVHLFGNRAPCDFDLPVLDDAAHPPASRGRLTALSAYPTKIWGAAGDGGFLVGEPEAIDTARRLGNHGHRDGGFHATPAVGRNSRLDAVQAAVLLGHAPQLAERIERRRALAAQYDAQLPEWVRPLRRDPGSPVQVYAVRAERERATGALDAAGVDWAVYYDRPLCDQPALQRRFATPVADALAADLLALPIHAHLADADVERVCRALSRA